MFRFTQREVVLGGVLLLGILSIAKSDESPAIRLIPASSIPNDAQIIGSFGKPLCTLEEFKGKWIVAYDHYLKDDVLHLRIDAVDGVELKEPARFPIRLVDILLQTSGLDPNETLKGVREGDVWEGIGFETAEIDWIPKSVYQLPGVVPWRDGRPKGVVLSLTCVRLSSEGGDKAKGDGR